MRISPKSLLISLALVMALATLITFLGVYDSDKMPFGERLLFWACTIGAGLGTAGFAAQWETIALLRKKSVALQLTVLSAVSSLPVLLVLFAFDTGFKRGWPITLWIYQYCLTLIIATLILSGICITLKALGLMDNEAEPEDETGDNAVENFLKRLPIEFQGATLYAVSSEDHYLRIHTDRGQELVLMRLADAMKELDAVDGCQTHRSWWVARVGIAKQFAKDGKPALMLKSGATASISRSRKIAVREVLL